jgi:predicted nucleic acid-binding protein
MSGTKAFFDTNVLLYLMSEDETKADRAEQCLAQGGVISVQVLNEFTSVASRKLKLSYPDIRDFLTTIRTMIPVEPLSLATHDSALALAERYGFSFYDALIVSSALRAGCDRLYTEDLQDGQVIDQRLLVSNPFAASTSG